MLNIWNVNQKQKEICGFTSQIAQSNKRWVWHFFDKLWAIDWWYYCWELLCLDHQFGGKNDLSTSEGTQVDSLTTSYGLNGLSLIQLRFFQIHLLVLIYSLQTSLTWELKVELIHPYNLNVTIKFYSRNSISK